MEDTHRTSGRAGPDPVAAVPLTDAGPTPYRATERALPRLVPGRPRWSSAPADPGTSPSGRCARRRPRGSSRWTLTDGPEGPRRPSASSARSPRRARREPARWWRASRRRCSRGAVREGWWCAPGRPPPPRRRRGTSGCTSDGSNGSRGARWSCRAADRAQDGVRPLRDTTDRAQDDIRPLRGRVNSLTGQDNCDSRRRSEQTAGSFGAESCSTVRDRTMTVCTVLRVPGPRLPGSPLPRPSPERRPSLEPNR